MFVELCPEALKRLLEQRAHFEDLGELQKPKQSIGRWLKRNVVAEVEHLSQRAAWPYAAHSKGFAGDSDLVQIWPARTGYCLREVSAPTDFVRNKLAKQQAASLALAHHDLPCA